MVAPPIFVVNKRLFFEKGLACAEVGTDPERSSGEESLWVWLVAVGYIGLAASQATAAPSSHHSDDLFPADDAHSHFHECDCNQWCCARYVTAAFAEWGRARA